YADEHGVAPSGIVIFHTTMVLHQRSPVICLNSKSGTVELARPGYDVQRFIPMTDGRPALKGARAIAGQLCRTTLALLIEGAQPLQGNLQLFQLPEGTPLADFPLPATYGATGFVLSSDGSKLARRSGSAKVVVHDLTGGGRAYWITSRGKYHQRIEV